MPFVRIWVHLIWGTKNREPIISKELRPKLLTHIKENTEGKGIYLDTINAVSDHAHALISLGSDQTIAKVAQLIKGESSHWVNEQKLAPLKFECKMSILHYQ